MKFRVAMGVNIQLAKRFDARSLSTTRRFREIPAVNRLSDIRSQPVKSDFPSSTV